jgi:thymidylate synthase ThyX
VIRAEMILDSVDPSGKHRMRTFKVRYPWFIHGEVMTHRVLSRNASSNRAIPLSKMLFEVRSDFLRAEPVFWGAEQKGMEPGGELSNENIAGEIVSPKMLARETWRQAAHAAAGMAEQLGNIGAHKSLCNRLLMPFTHANVVISGTEWDNFFGLRLDKAADPTMRALAIAMWEAQEESAPTFLAPGEWHLPFIRKEDEDEILKLVEIDCGINPPDEAWIKILIKISVARCARVSYESFETGKQSTVEEDLKLYDRLVGAQPLHASPAEHQATPDEFIGAGRNSPGWWRFGQEHGNLVGWRQFRKMLPNEAIAPLPISYMPK